MMIQGLNTNKRAGFHFSCDTPSLENRGNSYFVWLREDDDKVQFFKVIDDVYYQVEEAICDIDTSIFKPNLKK